MKGQEETMNNGHLTYSLNHSANQFSSLDARRPQLHRSRVSFSEDEDCEITAWASLPRQAGFTLIELLAVTSIIAVLIGLLLPAVQNLRQQASMMRNHSNLRDFGEEIVGFCDGSVRSAKSFFLELGTDAKNANSNPQQNVDLTSLQSLTFFCTADTNLTGFQNQVNDLLAESNLPAVQRMLLNNTLAAINNILPYYQNVGEVVRSVAGLCPGSASQ